MALIAPLLRLPAGPATETTCLRRVANAIFYLLLAGTASRRADNGLDVTSAQSRATGTCLPFARATGLDAGDC